MRDRHAPAASIARARFSDYGPLLRLGRTGEALALLLDCRQAFQDAHDTVMLGKTLSALANVEDQRGHGDAAIRLERDALRYEYLAGDVTGIAVSYHNLGTYLRPRPPARPALASHLAAALIRALTGIGGGQPGAHWTQFATPRSTCANSAPMPSRQRASQNWASQLGDIPGTDLPGLVATLSPDPETAQATLRGLVLKARELADAH